MKIKIKRLKMRRLRDMLGDEGGIGCFEICIGWNYPDLIALIPQCGSFVVDFGSCAVDIAGCIPEWIGLITLATDLFGALADLVDMVGFCFGK
jgi:hypothetical protein